MKKTNILIFGIALIVLLGGVLFLIKKPRITNEAGIPNNNRQGVEVFGLNEPDIDSLSTKNLGLSSRVSNTTHGYAFDVSNSWTVEVQKDALRIYSAGESAENNCLISSYIYTDQAPELKSEEIRTSQGRINLIAEDIDSIGRGNYESKVLKEYKNGEIAAETVYIPKNNKTYSFTSFYGHTHDGEGVAEYEVCHPLFTELLSTLTIEG